jgi:hypothetical protein
MKKTLGFRTSRAIVGAVALLALALPNAVRANDVINVPNVTLLPNTPNQLVTVTVTGMSQVAGEDFFAQIGDGGTFNNGVNTRPVFSNVDILTGTIFTGNNTGATMDPGGPESAHPLIWVDGTTTNTGTVPDGGLLATLTIDTTGISSGTFPLLLSGVGSSLTPGGFSTRLLDGSAVPVALTINNGSITISDVPEPVALPALGAIACLFLPRGRRRH